MRRRDFITLIGGAAAAWPLAARAQQSGRIVDARQFSPTPHAGTDADPWPSTAIKAAIESLPAGGTVFVANGIWLIDTAMTINRSNYTLKGESLNAILKFSGAGQFWFGSTFSGISNIHFTLLTWNFNQSNRGLLFPARVTNSTNCSYTHNKMLGHQDEGIPGMGWEGNDHNLFQYNDFHAGPNGGDSCLQVQSGTNISDSYVTIDSNTYNSTELVTIGIDHVTITNNTMTNTELGNSIAIWCCGKWGTTSRNNIIDKNTVDAGGSNGAYIGGLPNDPGGTSIIDGFYITNNIVHGTYASIACQSPDGNNYSSPTDLNGNIKLNVHITGNQITSEWGGAGINIMGGNAPTGKVDTVLVEANTLKGAAGHPNAISQDANTFNATIRNNTGV